MSMWNRIGRLLNPFDWLNEVDDLGNKVGQYANPIASGPGTVAENFPEIGMSAVRSVWDKAVHAVSGKSDEQPTADNAADSSEPEAPQVPPTSPRPTTRRPGSTQRPRHR